MTAPLGDTQAVYKFANRHQVWGGPTGRRGSHGAKDQQAQACRHAHAPTQAQQWLHQQGSCLQACTGARRASPVQSYPTHSRGLHAEMAAPGLPLKAAMRCLQAFGWPAVFDLPFEAPQTAPAPAAGICADLPELLALWEEVQYNERGVISQPRVALLNDLNQAVWARLQPVNTQQAEAGDRLDEWCKGGRSGMSAARSQAAPDLLGGLAK